MMHLTYIRSWMIGLAVLGLTVPVWAEPLSIQDREEINRLRAAQGHSAEDVASLLEQVSKAGEKGLPTEPLANKVKEGLAKGVEPKRIDAVVRQLVTHLETAQEILKEAGQRGMAEGNRQRAVEMMAEALSRGVSGDEVRELTRLSQDGKQKPTQEALAAGAKGVAVMKEGKIPSKDGTALIGEGLRQGYRSTELLDLSRDIKRRGGEFQDGRASLQRLREQISRGERGDRLLREERSGSGGDGDRSSSSDRGDRGDRSGSGDRGERGDRSGGSDHGGGGDRGGSGDRGGRPDRSGGHGGR
ncbi:MAG: hypothetical protein U0412_07040 [Nitrospira sp.]